MAEEYLKRTPTSDGNRKTFTISVWAKRNSDATSHRGHLFNAGPSEASSNDRFAWYLNSGHNLHLTNRIGGTYGYYQTPTAKYQDYSGWTHYLAYVDTTQDGVQEVKAAEYVNGVLQSAASNALDPIPQNYESWVNHRVAHYIGKRIDNLDGNWHGQMMDFYLVDGQALTPDVFGFYKVGDGYVSAGTTRSTKFRPGQWVPKSPSVIKNTINNNGGFGVNGVYLPMNDSSNFGADFHTTPNSIITLKGEDLPQPRNGAPTTTDAYVSQLRTDPYAANLVLALPFVNGGLGTDGTSSGINTGFGDYSAVIKGSGSVKVPTTITSVSIANTASYYGSSGDFVRTTNSGITFPASTDFSSENDITIEFWMNLKNMSNVAYPVGKWNSTDNEREYLVEVTTGGNFNIYTSSDGSSTTTISGATGIITSNQWNHIVYEKNGSNLTGYVNGVAVAISTNASIGYYSNPIRFGNYYLNASTAGIDGYIQDVRVYNTAKYKGGFDVPRPYTPVGIATWRAVSDCTANNFATWNLISKDGYTGTELIFTGGNLSLNSDGATGDRATFGTIGISTTSKCYFENYLINDGGTYQWYVGINTTFMYVLNNSTRFYLNGVYQDAISETNSTGDIFSVKFDGATREVEWYKNGVKYDRTYTQDVSDSYLPRITLAAGADVRTNFGQNPTFSGNTTAGTFADSNSKGLFKYEPPTDFLALCEDNLPTPAIKNPGKYFKTVLWDGDGNSGRSITGIGFTPDLVWIKERTSTSSHELFNSIVGPALKLSSNAADVESVNTSSLVSFDNDGFSVGSGGAVNESGQIYVAWCWRAGAGTTSTNTDGSITSVVSVNQDAGFSIVSYTGDGSEGATIGHGLDGKTPGFIIVKNREAEENWQVGHTSLGWTKRVFLDLTAEEQQPTSAWNDTAPTSSVITLGNGNLANQSSKKHIAYCWAEVEGFSKFGSYVGNGNADGPFVYCGFKPALVIGKRTDTANWWYMIDSARDSENVVENIVAANANTAENTYGTEKYDFLSNGFKLRQSGVGANANGGTYIFAAFAESPFQTANAK